MAKLDFSKLTPDNGAVRELSELIFKMVLGADALGKYLNVMPNVVSGSRLGFVGEFGMVGKAGQGCNPTYGNTTIDAEEKVWDLKEWEIAEGICYTDLESTIAKYALNTGTNRADVTSTQYMADIIEPRLELAAKKMLLRLAWFGDKNANTTDAGGILKTGVDKAFFNVTDGLWKRLFALGTANPERVTTITANAKTTKSEQKAAFKVNGYATGLMDAILEDAPMLLRQAEGQVVFITQSFKDALDADIKKNNKGSELQWQSIFDGIQETNYNGITVVVLPYWDEIIQGYEGTNDAWNKPYRAVYTTVDNLLVGIESQSELADLQVWFEKKDQMNYILAKDKLGTLIGQDNLVQLAY